MTQTTVPFVPVDPDGVMSIVVHVRILQTQRLAQPVPRQACFPVICAAVDFLTPEPNKRSSDKHSLSNSIRSFLAVKRQEVTGLVK